ncbi:hypothetical protein BLKGLAD_42810 [Burkholderia gladioli pv. gladioli]
MVRSHRFASSRVGLPACQAGGRRNPSRAGHGSSPERRLSAGESESLGAAAQRTWDGHEQHREILARVGDGDPVGRLFEHGKSTAAVGAATPASLPIVRSARVGASLHRAGGGDDRSCGLGRCPRLGRCASTALVRYGGGDRLLWCRSAAELRIVAAFRRLQVEPGTTAPLAIVGARARTLHSRCLRQQAKPARMKIGRLAMDDSIVQTRTVVAACLV